MNIIQTDWKWNGTLSYRSSTKYIVLHHAAASSCSAEQIDAWHKNKGWAGIGYHFFINKKGETYEGRPLNVIGAHCIGYNNCSIGICFEGNFETETPTNLQILSGNNLIYYLKKIYPLTEIKGHRDLYLTSCPGKNFNVNTFIDDNNNNKGEENMATYYDWTTACPKWSIPYVQKALDLGIIKGDEMGQLRLTDDKIWTLVVVLRAMETME